MQDQVALGALALTLLCQGRHRPRSWLAKMLGQEVDFLKIILHNLPRACRFRRAASPADGCATPGEESQPESPLPAFRSADAGDARRWGWLPIWRWDRHPATPAGRPTRNTNAALPCGAPAWLVPDPLWHPRTGGDGIR